MRRSRRDPCAGLVRFRPRGSATGAGSSAQDTVRAERTPHGTDVAAGGVDASVQHHTVALAEHVHRAPERHHDVLRPFTTPPPEGLRGARELHEGGDVVPGGEADRGQHLTARAVDGAEGLRPGGPHERGELWLQRWRLGRRGGRRIGGHRLGRARVTGSGEHPRSIPLRLGATHVHPLGGAAIGPTGHSAGTRPSDGQLITHGERIDRPASVGITLRTPIG
jgi:hypothetical protein